ncbi:MAG: LysR family glycine cleavage system transcriptional activator [Motiliproteus sp.]|jgi:LysR family glycine cleavage system transcriptional activator
MTSPINFQKLPPMKALKGFEAAARLLSFRKAADELNLTHPAISHQVHLLEGDLGVKLFVREGRNVALTKEAEQFYPIVRESLSQLVRGAQAIRQATIMPPLQVQTYVTASIRWLARRLPRFRALYPDIELQLDTCNAQWQFDEGSADIGVVYYATRPDPHLFWQPLFESRLFPVCSPQLLEGLPQPLQPAELLDLPLLTVNTEATYWKTWLDSVGLEQKAIQPPIVVDTVAIALQMAADGEGVSLVNSPFADDDLRSGRLVKPVEHWIPSVGEWGVICRNDRRDDPRVRCFIDWLLDDAARYPVG